MIQYKLSETRIRQIIVEEYLRENVDLIAEANDLFESNERAFTKAVQFVGEEALNLMSSREGRKVIASVFRLPLILVKYWEQVADSISHMGKRGGLFSRFVKRGSWLAFSPMKLIAIPLAKMSNLIEDMDDDLANFLVAGIRGKKPETQVDIGKDLFKSSDRSRKSDKGKNMKGRLPKNPIEPAEPRIKAR